MARDTERTSTIRGGNRHMGTALSLDQGAGAPHDALEPAQVTR